MNELKSLYNLTRHIEGRILENVESGKEQIDLHLWLVWESVGKVLSVDIMDTNTGMSVHHYVDLRDPKHLEKWIAKNLIQYDVIDIVSVMNEMND